MQRANELLMNAVFALIVVPMETAKKTNLVHTSSSSLAVVENHVAWWTIGAVAFDEINICTMFCYPFSHSDARYFSICRNNYLSTLWQDYNNSNVTEDYTPSTQSFEYCDKIQYHSHNWLQIGAHNKIQAKLDVHAYLKVSHCCIQVIASRNNSTNSITLVQKTREKKYHVSRERHRTSAIYS